MGRRKKHRCVAALPVVDYFAPQGGAGAQAGNPVGPIEEHQVAPLPVEGLEALRLVDAQGLSQEEAATAMAVSRPTLCRILADARRTVARALSQGLAIKVEGGSYTLAEERPCPAHNEHLAQPETPGGRCRGRCGRGPGRTSQ